MAKTVEDNTDKFVFDNAEELFPSPHTEPTFHQAMHLTKPVLETPEVEQDTDIKYHLQHDDKVTPEGEKETLSPDFLLSKV